jgi:hypothetical protein
MSGRAKVVAIAALFALALGVLAVAAAAHSAIPLFFMWLPLLAVPWLLARPQPGPTTPEEPLPDA